MSKDVNKFLFIFKFKNKLWSIYYLFLVRNRQIVGYFFLSFFSSDFLVVKKELKGHQDQQIFKMIEKKINEKKKERDLVGSSGRDMHFYKWLMLWKCGCFLTSKKCTKPFLKPDPKIKKKKNLIKFYGYGPITYGCEFFFIFLKKNYPR